MTFVSPAYDLHGWVGEKYSDLINLSVITQSFAKSVWDSASGFFCFFLRGPLFTVLNYPPAQLSVSSID